MSIDAMKLALEALVKLSDAADGFSVSGVYFNEEHWAKECLNKSYDAITALRQAIEQDHQAQASNGLRDAMNRSMDIAKQAQKEKQDGAD